MNRRYLIGTQFIIMTDQSTFQALYNNMRRMVPHRGHKEAFNMQVEYVREDKNTCNYSTRHLDILLENLTMEQKKEIGIETEEKDKEICIQHVSDSRSHQYGETEGCHGERYGPVNNNEREARRDQELGGK